MKLIFQLVTAIYLALTLQTTSSNEDYNEILRRTDFYRGGQVPGVQWDLQLKNFEGNELQNEIDLKVEASTIQNDQNVLITFIGPKKYEGQKLLVRNNSMWFTKKGLRGPIPISGRQRLSGSASNADVATANYINDYEIERVEEAILNDKPVWRFYLTAKNNLVTYSNVQLYVDKAKNQAIMANFYGKSGKLIKEGYFRYENEVSLQGKKSSYLSHIEIKSAIEKGDYTLLEIINPQFEEFANSKFLKNNL